MASLQVCKTQWNRNESARYQWKLGICHHFHEELHWLWDCWQRSLCFFFSFLWYSKQALVLLNRKKYSCVTCLQSGCRKRPENALIWQPSFMIVFIYPVEIMPGIERYFLWRKAPWLVFLSCLDYLSTAFILLNQNQLSPLKKWWRKLKPQKTMILINCIWNLSIPCKYAGHLYTHGAFYLNPL